MITTLALVLLGMVVHEAGHAAAARSLGLRYHLGLARAPYRVVIGVWFPGKIIPWQDAVIAASGPMASFLLAAALLPIFPLGAACSLMIGLLNLLPMRHSDGWRLCRALTPSR